MGRIKSISIIKTNVSLTPTLRLNRHIGRGVCVCYTELKNNLWKKTFEKVKLKMLHKWKQKENRGSKIPLAVKFKPLF